MKPTPEQAETIRLGIAMSEAIMETVAELLRLIPDGAHVGIVALTHAAVRFEMKCRAPGLSNAEYRKHYHEVLDEVMDYEEKRKALK